MAVRTRYRNPAALIALALAAGCAGGLQPLEWQLGASQAMQAYERLYLSGDTSAAEKEFLLARKHLTSTGRADLVARAELRRCAVRAASLEFDDCPGFERLRDGAGAEERAYGDYLAGKTSYRSGDEPLSRLVAAAVEFRKGGITPAGIITAVDVASAQGWRRALLAWLGVQAKRAQDAGDSETAARIRRRMDLISG